LVLLLQLVPGAGEAQDSADLIRAQAHSDAASALFKEGSYAAAIEELERANELVPAAVYLFNIARCYEEMGRLADAVEQFERYLARAEDRKRADRAKKAVARLVPSAYGSVEVGCVPEDARVELEGFAEEGCPYRRDRVRPGSYGLVVRAPEHAPHEGRLQVEVGAVARVEIELTSLPDEPGMRAAEEPPVVTGEPATAPRYLAWGLAGGAVAVAAGAGFAFSRAVAAGEEQDAAEAAYGRATATEDARRHGDAMLAASDRADGSLLAARLLAGVAVGLAVGSAWCFLWPSGADEDEVSVVPMAGGLALSRRW